MVFSFNDLQMIVVRTPRPWTLLDPGHREAVGGARRVTLRSGGLDSTGRTFLLLRVAERCQDPAWSRNMPLFMSNYYVRIVIRPARPYVIEEHYVWAKSKKAAIKQVLAKHPGDTVVSAEASSEK